METIECPYCDKDVDFEPEHVFKNDRREGYTVCDHCDKEFGIGIVVLFDAFKLKKKGK